MSDIEQPETWRLPVHLDRGSGALVIRCEQHGQAVQVGPHERVFTDQVVSFLDSHATCAAIRGTS